MQKNRWIAFSGVTWLGIGTMLLYKGVRFLSLGIDDPNSLSHLWATPAQGAAVLAALGFLVGYLKGLFVLSKTVKRVADRIRSLPEPLDWRAVYAKGYWFLIGGMVLLGASLRFLPIPIDVRGFIDLAVGSALIRGALLYFRAARLPRKGF